MNRFVFERSLDERDLIGMNITLLHENQYLRRLLGIHHDANALDEINKAAEEELQRESSSSNVLQRKRMGGMSVVNKSSSKEIGYLAKNKIKVNTARVNMPRETGFEPTLQIIHKAIRDNKKNHRRRRSESFDHSHGGPMSPLKSQLVDESPVSVSPHVNMLDNQREQMFAGYVMKLSKMMEVDREDQQNTTGSAVEEERKKGYDS